MSLKRISFRSLNSRGDTIVEVLIVLAILSLAFAFSLATATKGLSQSRNAEEHAQAQGHLSSQIELIRAAIASGVNVFDATSSFCMNGTTPVKFSSGTIIPNDSNVDSNGNYPNYPTACRVGDYNLSATYIDNADPSQRYFQLRARWHGVASLGPQQEGYTYRVHRAGSNP
jgi:prepilin-type N-terminal cleavage/methylation domain-containing protein